MERIMKERSLEENHATVCSSFYKGHDGPIRMYHITSLNPQNKAGENYDLRFEQYFSELTKNLGKCLGYDTKVAAAERRAEIEGNMKPHVIKLNANQQRNIAIGHLPFAHPNQNQRPNHAPQRLPPVQQRRGMNNNNNNFSNMMMNSPHYPAPSGPRRQSFY